MREFAKAELTNSQIANWVGTIKFNTGGVMVGEHTPGDAIVAARLSRLEPYAPG